MLKMLQTLGIRGHFILVVLIYSDIEVNSIHFHFI